MRKVEENHTTCIRVLQCDKQKLYKYLTLQETIYLSQLQHRVLGFMRNDEMYKKFGDEGKVESTNKLFYTVSPMKQGREPICVQVSLPLELKT